MKRQAVPEHISATFFSSEGRDEMLLDDDDEEDDICCGAAGSAGGGKKRRLGTEQVRALERCFEIENKLDPERKARLAQELGLQPRQIAVWFQNRRARWKTKQLERDFAALKSRYDALRLDYESLHRDNHCLAAELAELRSKKCPAAGNQVEERMENSVPVAPPAIASDGFSDSDSSVVLADEYRMEGGIAYQAQQMFKMEEHCFIGEEEPCSAAFFSDEHVPTLGWLCSDLAGGGGGGW